MAKYMTLGSMLMLAQAFPTVATPSAAFEKPGRVLQMTVDQFTGDLPTRATGNGRSAMAILTTTYSDELASLTGDKAKVFGVSSVGSGAGAQRQPKPSAAPTGPAGAELQNLLMRFADRSVYATLTAFDQFHLELDTPDERAAALERRHFMTSAVVTIATQPDPDVALLDMIVLVTLERMGAERLWLPTVFGEAGRPYLMALRKLEETIWALGERVMTPPQIQELGAIVADWENNSPGFFRTASFFRQSRVSADRVRSAGAGVNRSRGLFASIRAAASSADDVRLQVERLIFLLQRMPTVVGAQAEYQLSKLGRAPEIAGTLEEVSGALAALRTLAELADRVGPAAERLGVLLGDETTDLGEMLESGDERIRRLLGEVRATTEAGNALVAALNTTVERATDLTTKVELPIEHLDAIRSEEMRASLAELTATASHLEAVVAGAERLLGSQGLEQAAPGLEAAMEQVGGVGERLIDQAFVAGAKLIVIFLIGLLVTLSAYRYLAGMMPMTAITQKGSAT